MPIPETTSGFGCASQAADRTPDSLTHDAPAPPGRLRFPARRARPDLDKPVPYAHQGHIYALEWD